MASFEVVYKNTVEKDLTRIPSPVVARILARIEGLKQQPFPRGSVKIASAERMYRLRVSDYRIVYEIDQPAHKIIIHYVRHRRDAYR